MKHLLFVLAAVIASEGFAAEVVTYRYLRVPKSVLTDAVVKQTGFIEDHFHDDEFVVGYLPEKAVSKMNRSFWEQSVELNPAVWAHQQFDIKTLKPIEETFKRVEFPFEDFHTYETLTQEIKLLGDKYKDLVTVESAGKTVEGRELWLLRVSNKKVVEANKPKLLFISSMHGDEVTGKEMMVYLLRELLGQHGKDQRITDLVNHAELFIIPSMNPDGTVRQQRFNANGVDLNRDFPELNEDPFGGNRAIETRNIMELHKKHSFLLSMNFHGGSLCINIPWDSKVNSNSGKFGDDLVMHTVGRKYADANHPMTQNNGGNFDRGLTYGYEWYPVYGGMQDWASFFLQGIHATAELSYPKWPSASALGQYWADNKNALIGYLEDGTIGLHLQVVNSANQPVDVEVAVSSANRTLKYPGGVVHRVALLGSQTVTLSAPGYKTKTLQLQAYPFQGQYDQIVLDK